MEWLRDLAPRGMWSERLLRYANTGLTVAAFCERERVSVPTFYYELGATQKSAGNAGPEK